MDLPGSKPKVFGKAYAAHSIAWIEQQRERKFVIRDEARGQGFTIGGYAVDGSVELTEIFGIVSKPADLCHADWSESTEIEK